MKSAPRIAAFAAAIVTVAACATARRPATDIRSPLSATLGAGAATGMPVSLRFDPNAKVILSTAANLPAASYAPSQAARGEKVYNETCGMCHAGGALIGEQFTAMWKDRRVYDLYALVRGTMPLDNPGGLKEGEYLDVIAYLLKANNHVAPGPDSLKADTAALRKTKIDVR